MAERVPFRFNALPDVAFEVEPPSGFGSWKLFANGAQIKPTRNKLSVPCPNGKTVEINVKAGLDQAPTFQYQAEEIKPLPGIATPLLVLAALPIGLIAAGGAVGGALGGLAFAVNLTIARQNLALAARVVLMLVMGAVAVGIWLAIAAAIRG
ncbi:MAG: hypothetical protein H6713_27650 [Myxococcales bacterium]|nr:hypothetical protein [Myxococcales bacterium]